MSYIDAKKLRKEIKKKIDVMQPLMKCYLYLKKY